MSFRTTILLSGMRERSLKIRKLQKEEVLLKTRIVLLALILGSFAAGIGFDLGKADAGCYILYVPGVTREDEGDHGPHGKLPPRPCPAATPTPTSTSTPPTTIPSKTPTKSPTATQTPTSSPTASSTASPTLSATPTNSPTNTPTLSPTATQTPTSSPTASSTASPTLSATPTNSPTNTPTLSPTATQTPTSSPTSTSTPTVSPTPTQPAENCGQMGDWTITTFKPVNFTEFTMSFGPPWDQCAGQNVPFTITGTSNKPVAAIEVCVNSDAQNGECLGIQEYGGATSITYSRDWVAKTRSSTHSADIAIVFTDGTNTEVTFFLPAHPQSNNLLFLLGGGGLMSLGVVTSLKARKKS